MIPNNPRIPSAVDRPPVTRVGDELAHLVDEAEAAGILPLDASSIPELTREFEREAVRRARSVGWNHSLDDVDPRRHQPAC